MTPAFEGTYHYTGYHGSRAHCWLRVFKDPDRPAVVIATEAADNLGTSITHAAETLAADVCRRHEIDPGSLLWVEHYEANRVRPEKFSLVEFRDDVGCRPGGLGRPAWSPTTRDRVEALIGCIVTPTPTGRSIPR